MEQTDRGNSPLLDAERTMDLRRSQINLLSTTLDEANFYINEVSSSFFLYHFQVFVLRCRR